MFQPFIHLQRASILVVALSLFLAALCSGCRREVQYLPANILGAALASDPETFDPGAMSGSVEGSVAYQIFEGLLSPPPGNGPPVPGAAASWEVSDDGILWTFHLRPEGRWSNGDPLVAEDFRYAWLRILRGEVAADYVNFIRLLKNAEAFEAGDVAASDVGVRAPDEHTLVLELERPVPYFLEIITFYTFFPVHRGSIEEHGQDGAFMADTIVTNGPFRIREYRRRNRVHLERNPNYWGADEVALDEVYMEVVEDLAAQVSAFRDGRVDWADDLPNNQLRSLRAMPEFHSADWLGVYFYRLNITHPQLSDRRVRQALSLAINREELCRCTLDELYSPTAGFVPPIPGYPGVDLIRFDPDRARELMAEAGYADGAGFEPLELLYNTSENHRVIAEALQDIWQRELGIEVNLLNQEWKVYLESMDNLEYQVARAGWIGDYVDANTFLEMWRTGDSNNRTGFADATYDGLIDQAMAEQDPEERLRILTRAETRLLEEMPIIPVYTYAQFHLLRPEVQGWEMNTQNVHLFRYMSKSEVP
jgi:oligopeptide transport system substrate-binding protein